MTNSIKIEVTALIGSKLCVSAEDAQKVFKKIEPFLKSGERVVVSFKNATLIVSLFLHIVIGQLYRDYSEETIKNQIIVEGLDTSDQDLLNRVIENAKKYYKQPQEYNSAWEEEVDDEK